MRIWNLLLAERSKFDRGNKVDKCIDMRVNVDHAIPLVARPLLTVSDFNPPSRAIVSRKNQYVQIKFLSKIEYLYDRFIEISRYVEPKAENLSATGEGISSFVVNAAISVENIMKLILRANGVQKKKDRFSTSDFLRLAEPMQLSEYTLQLSRFPWLGEITPFQGWDKQCPTESLGWYESSNAAKHDAFSAGLQPNLLHALEALCANLAVYRASFGNFTRTNRGSIVFDHTDFENVPAFAIEDSLVPLLGADRGWEPKVQCLF